MKPATLFLAALVLVGPCACGPMEAEAQSTPRPDAPAPIPSAEVTPAEALASMLALAEAGRWGQFVDEYYGETAKFRSDADRDALVARFEGAWGEMMLEALRTAHTLPSRIDAEGRAVFVDDGHPAFMLHPHANGGWAFHL